MSGFFQPGLYALITASCRATDSLTCAGSRTSAARAVRLGCFCSFSGWRTTAVTRCPRSSASPSSAVPTNPVAPINAIFMDASLLPGVGMPPRVGGRARGWSLLQKPQMPAKVVVSGSGAREHALVRALRRGGGAREIVAIPGNPGIAREARCMPALPSLADAALAESPDLVVVGPEAPLAEGFADRMAERQVPCLGPSQAAARIESSKAFAKEVMQAAGVPTAAAAVFDDPAAAREHARAQGACVVKLDGLAAGKGVIVAGSGEQAAAAVDELWRPGATLLVEERLEGPELSVIALCDGEQVVPLPPARDHKRLQDGDRGPNTGGMGAFCPPADATQELIDQTVRTVLEPTARELARRGSPFVGAL